VGLGQDLAFPFPGQGPQVLSPDLACLVEAYFDCFPVQDAVAAVDPLPHAGGAQLRCCDGGLDAEAVQVVEVIVGHEPGMAAGRGVRRGGDLKIVGCP
jgi:hypothetical protein